MTHIAMQGRRSTAWVSAISITTAIVIGGVAARAPIIAAVLVVLVALGVTAFLTPKPYVVVSLVVILLSGTLESRLGAVGVSNLDEAVIAVGLLANLARPLVERRLPTGIPGLGWFAGFTVVGMISVYAHDVPVGTWAPGVFLALKAVLFALMVAQIPWTTRDMRVASYLGAGLILVMIPIAIINVILPATWTAIFSGDVRVDRTFGLPSLVGIFVHPAAFGRIMALLAIAVLTYQLVIRTTPFTVILLTASSLMAFMSFRTKTFGSLLTGAIAVSLRFLSVRGTLILLLISPIALFLALSNVVDQVVSDVDVFFFGESARAALIDGGLSLAAQYFPFGAGFGRYASATAASIYSPEYGPLGFEYIYGLGSADDGGMFLNDTQWPAILGESGWIGAACFAIGLGTATVRMYRRSGRDDDQWVRWTALTGFGWLFVFVVESLAAPAFTSPPSYALLLLCPAIIAGYDAARRRTVER